MVERLLKNQFVGFGEQFPENTIKPVSDVSSQLQMLGLVFSNWDVRGLIQEDIGGHQHGVRVQAEARELIALVFLLFELNHLVQPRQRSQRRKKPLHLQVSWNMRLYEQS